MPHPVHRHPSTDFYDLRTRPWVPVISGDRTQSVGLCELFLRAHEFTALGVALPPAASGLHRILCAMAARITGLDTATGGDEWQERRYELLDRAEGFAPGCVRAYFNQHADGLRLHDPARPFLQDPRLAEECPSSSGVNKLVLARPAGNNQVFFGHFTDDEQVALPSGEAVLHLIAQLYYGPSGQCTPRTVDGERFGNTMAGPLRRVLSTHPVGPTLFDSLLMGIPEPAAWPSPSPDCLPDGCPWERETLPAPRVLPLPPAGPLSLLTEQYQHAVLLKPGPTGNEVVDATITWALRVNRPAVRDPYLIWDTLKDGTPRPRDAKAERALWRDLDALVLMKRADGGRRPHIFDGLSGWLPEPVAERLRVTAFGFDQDGQTRDRTYFSAITPPLFSLLTAPGSEQDNALALGVREGREAAEKAAWHLSTALRSAWRSYTTPFADEARPDTGGGRASGTAPASNAGAGGGGSKKSKHPGPWPEAALTAYWPAAEERFWDLLHSADFSDSLRVFGTLALEIYDRTTAPVASSPRGAKAREHARGLVRSLLEKRRDTAHPTGQN
ncbi:type I-E CRISPR-associated protein Cse1/CasA [Streptomyces sp. ISL-99]|uniref:type I-E CRISPR-associated protein Cse1/CasA n=1 Tax=Streptomyces sp. ISL-99 TaxID=2819193 RepID=UPI001BEAABF6|nr:type I-E CRISPR-associated protein Cse1/CasA [Streptomyces sp. ISL-99]MBT2526317.1 type I-E CRISPR-associated protein Cse1/CasA [Streptomyces sp. ISL-99]